VLEIRGITKLFRTPNARFAALRGVDLSVDPGEFFVLLGPSGCGKTTILRSIAGLEKPDEGTIRIDGQTVFSGSERINVPPEYRPIAMVFQSYAVWPHMNVYENVAFPLREGVRPLERKQLRERVTETLQLLELTGFAERPVTTLSGGQQQRVAVARAIALRPKVLLMDEPLSNLDFKLQVQLRGTLKELMRHFELTTIYVTHNQTEAMELGDRIAVLNAGQVAQIGTPRNIYCRPHDEFVARFVGEMSFLPATMIESNGDTAIVDTPCGRFRALTQRDDLTRGAPCLLGIRPEALSLIGPDEVADGNVLNGDVTHARFVGEAMVYIVRAGAAEIAFKTADDAGLELGTSIRLRASPERCVVVAKAPDDAQLDAN
jgi:iron(III) transport system ATP-binding protein